MQRLAKTFSAPKDTETATPSTNKFTIDLGNLPLSESHISDIRAEAVKAAMAAAAQLVGRKGGGAFSDFATFSTFSTFSTFGSGSSFERDLPEDVRAIINDTLRQGAVTAAPARTKASARQE